MKTLPILGLALMLCTPAALADASAIYNKSCASCHGKDGAGKTTMGKKNGAKDYTTAEGQNWTDADGVKAILEGVKDGSKTKMKAFAGKVTEDEAKALVQYIRGLKK